MIAGNEPLVGLIRLSSLKLGHRGRIDQMLDSGRSGGPGARI